MKKPWKSPGSGEPGTLKTTDVGHSAQKKKLIRDQSILIIFWLAEFGTLPVCDLRLSHGRLCIGGIPSFRHTQISHRLLPYIQIISHYACKMVRLFIPIICQSSRLWNVWYSHYIPIFAA
jgi:hypothetical protein